MDDERFFLYAQFVSIIPHRVGAILLSYLATNNKIKEMYEIKWYDENLSRLENKENMKIVGGSAMSYNKFIKEMTIVAVSKSIEDLLNDLNEEAGLSLEFWDLDASIVFYDEMKKIRNMNNCIKHSNGIVKDDQSNCNRYLIDVCGLTPDYEITLFEMDYEKVILNNFFFQYDLFCKTLNYENVWTEINDESYSDLKKYLIPPILNLY